MDDLFPELYQNHKTHRQIYQAFYYRTHKEDLKRKALEKLAKIKSDEKLYKKYQDRKRAINRRYRQRVQHDKIKRDIKLQKQKDYFRRMRENTPEKYNQLLEKARIASREKYRKVKQDPDRYKKLLEYNRLYRSKIRESKRQLDELQDETERFIDQVKEILLGTSK